MRHVFFNRAILRFMVKIQMKLLSLVLESGPYNFFVERKDFNEKGGTLFHG